MINRPECGRQVQHPDDQTSATWQHRQQLELSYHRQSLTEILAFHIGQSVERIYQDTESDYFLSPLEAQQYGIIDQCLSVGQPSPRDLIDLISSSTSSASLAV
jgi:ATP-dependent protease ClpP protease subunit